MNELSLFSGAGGGLLASKLLGWKTVGYVEYEDYCQRVIRARINDGYLDEAPIFGDIRTFISDGYAESYQGMVDVVSAGFPCQPFSSAGKQKGESDERNMWPATIDVIRKVRPRFAFLENVPGLLTFEYMGTILADLAAAGMDAKWTVLGAGDIGECHSRERLWIVASHANSEREMAGLFGTICNEGKGTQLRQFARAIRKGVPAIAYSGTLRNIDELAGWVDRHKAIGNGQHARVAATAWRLLNVST